MSEFKGTSGIWVIDGSYDISTTEGVPVLDCGCGCCSYHSVQKADLQLMSKALKCLKCYKSYMLMISCFKFSQRKNFDNLQKTANKYIEIHEDTRQARDKYYRETQYLKKVVESSSITQEFLNEENKRLKRRNRILTIGFILSASFYLIASIL